MKTVGVVLLVFGIEALLVSLFAEQIAYVPGPGFGLYQIIGTIGGVILIVLGIVVVRRK